MKKNFTEIEIPFGVKDSELYQFTYTIPDGYSAEIKDGKVIVKKKESEDEKIRKNLIELLLDIPVQDIINHHLELSKVLAYLEKQEEQNIYKNSKSEIDFADRYSKDVWEKLMSKFKVIGGYSIGCNDVSDIVLNAILNAFKWQKAQKSTEWNGEDEKHKQAIIDAIQIVMEECGDAESIEKYLTDIDWLENRLKYLYSEPKQQWSEEDEKMLESIIHSVNGYDATTGTIPQNFEQHERKINWLKSLRPQPHWKPSAEQMDHLAYAYTQLKLQKCYAPHVYESLGSLYDDLKKHFSL